MRYITVSLAYLLYALPQTAGAAGLVPCGATGQAQCQTCDLVVLSNNVLLWIFSMLAIIAGIVIVYTGIVMVTSRGDASLIQQAKGYLTNIFIGLVIVFAAWFIVDTVGEYLLGVDTPWNALSCVEQPEFEYEALGRLSASGLNDPSAPPLSPADVQGQVLGIVNSGDVNDMANAALDAMGITDPVERANYRALIAQESSNCTNKTGPETGKGRGRAYGCVQILVGTARELDRLGENRFANASDADVAATMRDDEAYNITLGALYYKQGLDKYDGNVEYALARYNGGDAALKPSTSCPGQTWYQCEANEGYAQTRKYVQNINAMAEGLLNQ